MPNTTAIMPRAIVLPERVPSTRFPQPRPTRHEPKGHPDGKEQGGGVTRVAYDAVRSGSHQLVSLAKADLECKKATQGTVALKAKKPPANDEDHPDNRLQCQFKAI